MFFSNAVDYGVSVSVLELNATKQAEGTVYKCIANIGFLNNVLSQSITVKYSKFILDDLVFHIHQMHSLIKLELRIFEVNSNCATKRFL